MKLLVLISTLIVSNSAFAETLYPCQVTIRSKQAQKTEITRQVFLSGQRRSKVDFRSSFLTELDLQVSRTGLLEGTVNGQPQFILEGSISSGGRFESFAATGTITCEPGRDFQAGYKSRYSGEIRLMDLGRPLFSAASAVTNYCFFGSPQTAKSEIEKSLNLKPDAVAIDSAYTIKVGSVESRCLTYVGDPRDDGRCEKYDSPKTYTYEMPWCDYDPYP